MLMFFAFILVPKCLVYYTTVECGFNMSRKKTLMESRKHTWPEKNYI